MNREMQEAMRMLKLEETRLRSAALAFSLGIGTQEELAEAALNYGSAARNYKWLESEHIKNGRGVTYTPQEAEMVR
jgi:hypothetical protein